MPFDSSIRATGPDDWALRRALTTPYCTIDRDAAPSRLSDDDVQRIAAAVVDALRHRSPLDVTAADVARFCPSLTTDPAAR